MSESHPERSPRGHPPQDDKRTLFDRLVEFVAPGPDSKYDLLETLADAEKRELIEPESRLMLEGVIRMADMRAGDVMVAAPRMDQLDIDAPYDELLAVVIETGHSRFPVFEGQRDNVIGILMAKDLLKLQRSPDLNLRTLLRPAVFVPESKRLNELLRDFRSNRNHLAMVIDEFGNTAGLITIEDVLEEIVGEIEDEFDEQDGDSSVYTLADGSHRVAGDAAISSVNTAFGTTLLGDRIRHHRWPDRAPPRPRPAPRRGGRRRQPEIRGDAHTRRRGALVPGFAPGTGRRRRRLRLNADQARPWPLAAEAVAAAVLGAVFSLSCVVTQAWWLQLLCAGLLAWRAAGVGPARAAMLGLAFGSGWLGAGTWWLFISLHRYGGLPAPLAGLAVAALALALSVYLGDRDWRCSRDCNAAMPGSTRRCSPRSGWPPNWRAARCLPAFRGRRPATARSTARSLRWRPGSACTASALSPLPSRRCRHWRCARAHGARSCRH